MNTGECMELRTFGNCSKGDMCIECNKNKTNNSQSINTIDKNPMLNIKAKEFIPKKKQNNTNTSNTDNSGKTTEIDNKLLKLNLNATEYVPSKPNVNMNLNNTNTNSNSYSNTNSMGKQYNDFQGQQNTQNYPNNFQNEFSYGENSKEPDDDAPFDELEPNDDELDMIMKDMMENNDMEAEEESDDEKWFPKFKDCECCKGFVYKCKGNACQYLGACYCKVKNECDDGNN